MYGCVCLGHGEGHGGIVNAVLRLYGGGLLLAGVEHGKPAFYLIVCACVGGNVGR